MYSCRNQSPPLARSSSSTRGEIREHSVAGTEIRSHRSPPHVHSSQKNPRIPYGVLISHRSPSLTASVGHRPIQFVRYPRSLIHCPSSFTSPGPACRKGLFKTMSTMWLLGGEIIRDVNENSSLR